MPTREGSTPTPPASETSGFPMSPLLTVTYCFRCCNYIFVHAAAWPDILSPVSPFPHRWRNQRRRSQICPHPSLWLGLRSLRLDFLAVPLRLEACGWALCQALLFEQRWIALELTWVLELTSTDWFFYHQPAVGSDYWSRCSLACLLAPVSIMLTTEPLCLKTTHLQHALSTCRCYLFPCDLLLPSTWRLPWRTLNKKKNTPLPNWSRKCLFVCSSSG